MKFTKSALPLLLILASSYSKAQLVESTGFESQNVGVNYSSSIWQSDGFDPDWVQGMDTRSEVDDEQAYSGSKSLRLKYPQGEYGPGETGGQTPLLLPAESEYYMSYWLRFDDNFSWGGTSQGGKLPGLAAGDNCSGCSSCNGTNGFTARFMWRTDGKAVLYLYHMDKESSCGDDHELKHSNGSNVFFPKGDWVHLIERVKINSGNNADGEVQVWFNGEEVLSMEGIQFVNNGQKIDNLYFSTFHGGSGTQWAPQNDSYIWFDDLKISTNKSDVDQVLNTVSNEQFTTDYSISPNPTTHSFLIHYDSPKSLVVSNSMGQVIYDGTVYSGDQVGADWPKGVYFFTTDGQTERLIKK